MRKIAAGLFISLDGVVEAPEKWHMPFDSAESLADMQRNAAASDTILLGRKTYQEFASFWPTEAAAGIPLAEYLNATPKLVASSTLESADWQNSSIIEGDVAEHLRRVKSQPGTNIQIIGSPTLVKSLIKAGLLDELSLLVDPIVVGTGARLFDDLGGLGLELLDTKTYETGEVALTYAPAGA